MYTTLVLNTKTEFLKSKGTAAFWLTVVAAALIPVVNFIVLIARADHFVPYMSKNPWGILIDNNWKAATLFLLPMFVILVCSLVIQVEYRNNTWKQVYASPRSYADIFFSKFFVIHSLVLFCFILFNCFIIITACAANIIKPAYNFFDYAIPWKTMGLIVIKVYFSVLAITAIQYWLILRFRNFIAPMGIGLALLITGLIIHEWEKLYFYPYMYPAIMYWPEYQKHPEIADKVELYNIIYFVVILGLAFLDTIRRKERG